MRDKIRKFIESNLNIYDDSVELKDEDDIFQLGFVDSMFALQLVTFVENEFGLRVENEDINLANFNSVSNLAQFVERKLAAK